MCRRREIQCVDAVDHTSSTPTDTQVVVDENKQGLGSHVDADSLHRCSCTQSSQLHSILWTSIHRTLHPSGWIQHLTASRMIGTIVLPAWSWNAHYHCSQSTLSCWIKRRYAFAWVHAFGFSRDRRPGVSCNSRRLFHIGPSLDQ